MSSVMYLAARLVGLPLSAIAMALLARTVGVDGFGTFSLAFGLVTILNNIGDFGLGQVIVRELAARPAERPGLTAAFLVVRTTTSLVLSAGAILFMVSAAPAEAFLATILIVFSLPLQAISGLTAVARARLRPQIQGYLNVVQGIIWLGLVGLLALTDGSITWFGAAYLASAMAEAVGAVWTTRRLVAIDLRAARRHVSSLVKQSLPVGLTGLFVSAYYRLDQVILYQMSGSHAAGLYGAAYRYLDVVQLIPGTLLATSLPVLSRLRAQAREGFERVSELTITLTLAAAIPVAVLGVLWSHELVNLLFGHEFGPAADLLAILAPASIAIFLGYVSSGLLISVGKARLLCWVAAPAAIANISLNLLLIPRYGAAAAAWITLGTEVAVSSSTFLLMLRATGLRAPAKRLVACGRAAVIMVVIATSMTILAGSSIIAGVVSVAAYAAALLIGGALTTGDLRALMNRRGFLDA